MLKIKLDVNNKISDEFNNGNSLIRAIEKHTETIKRLINGHYQPHKALKKVT